MYSTSTPKKVLLQLIVSKRKHFYDSVYTVSWWIRILSCIENVPLVHFSIEFNFKLKIFNWVQFVFKLCPNLTLNRVSLLLLVNSTWYNFKLNSI
jgi:hypothetical protein